MPLLYFLKQLFVKVIFSVFIKPAFDFIDISPFYQVNLACGYLEIHARGLLRSFGIPKHILLIEMAKKFFWEK